MANGTCTATRETTIDMMTLEIGSSDYGTPQPQVRVSFPAGPSYRQCRAAMFRLAAVVEEHSVEERWVVIVRDVVEAGHGRKQSCLDLELFNGSKSEVETGLDVLRQAIQEVA